MRRLSLCGFPRLLSSASFPSSLLPAFFHVFPLSSSFHISPPRHFFFMSAADGGCAGVGEMEANDGKVGRHEAYLEAVLQKRIRMFERIQAEQIAHRQEIGGELIKITLPDGNVKEGKKWLTSPMDVAKEISKGLFASALISKVNGTLWDMTRPLVGDCQVELFKFDSNEGRDTFWHSSAHILGESLEREYGCKLCIGPCTTRGEGFYYDAFYNGLTLNEEHFDLIKLQAMKAVAEKQPFERIEVSRKQALELFAENNFKEYLTKLEEAKKYDHRIVGLNQELFFFHPLSPGSCFFLPNGTRIYNKLMEFIRAEYRNRGYEEVLSPNIYNMQLWETSGHAANYKENMFVFEVEKQEFALKPMNCPGHCVMFDHRVRSYRELPLRFADFGVLHGNELSGALTGLTRVRRFQQVKDEVRSVLEFIERVYDIFGFTFELELSTRPTNFLGDIPTWEKAEAALADALNEFGRPWQWLTSQIVTFYVNKLANAGDYVPFLDFRTTWSRSSLVCRFETNKAGYYVDVDTTDRKIQKKVREAQLAQYNYILVVGEEEAKTGTVSVRIRDKADHFVKSIDDVLSHFTEETLCHSINGLDWNNKGSE